VQRVTRDERGAVAVIVALLMVPLLGFAAISLDVASLYLKRQQLQTGADAAALAIAQQCNRDTCTSASAATQAQTYAQQNVSGSVTGTVTSQTTSKVTVRASTTQQHLFAPILGVASTPVTASATVGWGSPLSGTAVLPLAFSWCEWKAQTGGGLPSGTVVRTIRLSKTSDTTDCTGPSNLLVPGGFGWLTTNPGSCHVTSAIGGILHSDPGNSVPGSCSSTDLSKAVNRTVLLPVFAEMSGTGSGATYTVYGYAAFVMTGYFFGSHDSYNSPCKGNERCIHGYFSKFVDSSEAFAYGVGAPPLGASIISLST
jgi:Flp pilus assembly protein TadG